jgi:hypothetical protein
VRQAVLPLLIHGKSRMRRRARRICAEAIIDDRPYRDNNPPEPALLTCVDQLSPPGLSETSTMAATVGSDNFTVAGDIAARLLICFTIKRLRLNIILS